MKEPVKKNKSDFWEVLRVPDIVKQRVDVIKKQSKFWKIEERKFI